MTTTTKPDKYKAEALIAFAMMFGFLLATILNVAPPVCISP